MDARPWLRYAQPWQLEALLDADGRGPLASAVARWCLQRELANSPRARVQAFARSLEWTNSHYDASLRMDRVREWLQRERPVVYAALCLRGRRHAA